MIDWLLNGASTIKVICAKNWLIEFTRCGRSLTSCPGQCKKRYTREIELTGDMALDRPRWRKTFYDKIATSPYGLCKMPNEEYSVDQSVAWTYVFV